MAQTVPHSGDDSRAACRHNLSATYSKAALRARKGRSKIQTYTMIDRWRAITKKWDTPFGAMEISAQKCTAKLSAKQKKSILIFSASCLTHLHISCSRSHMPTLALVTFMVAEVKIPTGNHPPSPPYHIVEAGEALQQHEEPSWSRLLLVQ